MKITALPYSVKLEFDGKVVTVPTHNAEGIFKSLKLDEAKEKINIHLQEYWDFSKAFEAMSEEEKNSKAVFDKLTAVNKKLKRANIEYLSECIKDIGDYEQAIDEIKSSELQSFMSAVERSMFGQADSDEKKKIVSSITSKNSGDTVTPRKRSKSGQSSKSITS